MSKSDEKSEAQFVQSSKDFVNSYFYVEWEDTGVEHVYIKDTGRFERQNLYVICDWRVHHLCPSCSFVFARTKEEAVKQYISGKC